MYLLNDLNNCLFFLFFIYYLCLKGNSFYNKKKKKRFKKNKTIQGVGKNTTKSMTIKSIGQ